MSTTPDDRHDAETHPSAPDLPPPPPAGTTETFETSQTSETSETSETQSSAPGTPETTSTLPADVERTGAHAAPRPYPPSAPTNPTTPTTPPLAPFGAPDAGAAPTHGTHDRYASTDAPDSTATPSHTDTTSVPAPMAAPVAVATQPLPERPAKPGFGRHLLAIVLGLVLTPFALLLVGIGTSGLAEIAGKEDVSADILSLTLLLAGVAVLAAVVLLGAWSPAMPIAGGLVWGVTLGVAYLVMPNRMANSAESLTSDGSVPESIEQLADAAMSGYLLVLGILLVAAGIAAGIARRTGRRWAEAVAVADRARAEADHARAEHAGPDAGPAGNADDTATRRTRRQS